MTELLLTIHSFNSLKTCLAVGNQLKKKFNFYLFMYILLSFSKASFKERKVFKRQVVVLKSPFHYKLPKHHLMYNFFVTTCRCYVLTNQAEALVTAITSVFYIVNVTKVKIGSPAKIELLDLLL